MKTATIKPVAKALAAIMAAGFCVGCWSEDKLAGTPTDLPPGTMTPAPPLELSPADLAKVAKAKKKHRP